MSNSSQALVVIGSGIRCVCFVPGSEHDYFNTSVVPLSTHAFHPLSEMWVADFLQDVTSTHRRLMQQICYSSALLKMLRLCPFVHMVGTLHPPFQREGRRRRRGVLMDENSMQNNYHNHS